MKSTRTLLAGVVTTGLALAAAPVQGDHEKEFKARLKGVQEVPSISTGASGRFQLEINERTKVGRWKLRYGGLEGDVQQAHIHFAQKGVNGGITVFLCTNLGNGPAGGQMCPPSPGEVTGELRESDVSPNIPATAMARTQGIGTGEINELIKAIKQGVTYVNVHSTVWPGGEIRGQLKEDDDDD